MKPKKSEEVYDDPKSHEYRIDSIDSKSKLDPQTSEASSF